MGTTRSLNDALLLDLNGISDPAGVKAKRASLTFQTAQDRQIGLQSGGVGPSTEGEALTAGNETGSGLHRATLKLFRKANNAEQVMDDFIDAVRNAIEDKDSNIHAEPGVLWAAVVSAEPFHGTEDLKNSWAGVQAVVEIAYDYARGNL